MNSDFKGSGPPQFARMGGLRALILLLVFFAATGVASAQTNGLFNLSWSTVNGASGVSSNGNWQISGTAGQPDAGTLTQGSWVISGGFWNQVVINTRPVAGLATFSRPRDLGLIIAITNLLTNATDAEGDTLSLVAVSTNSTNGATISANAHYVFYSPPATNGNVTDTFSYTVTDPYGGTGTGPVVVTIQSDYNGPSVNITGITTNGNGTVTIGFAGIPNLNYLIQAATNLSPPITWTTLATNTAGTNGLFQYTDGCATNYSTRYYRTAIPQD